MDRENILSVLNELGAKNITEYKRNIQCTCLLADWRLGHSFGSDHAGSMGISIEPDGPSKVNCFACKFGGSFDRLIRLVSKYTQRDLSKLIKKVVDLEDVDLEYIANSVGSYTVIRDQLGLFSAPSINILGDCLLYLLFEKGVHSYLLERGFSADTLRTWECLFDASKRRVVFPVRIKEANNDPRLKGLVGAVGRAVFDAKIKYYNYFNFNKSGVLYGEHLLNTATTGVVVEGVLDTLVVWEELKKADLLDRIAVVGILGSSASDQQISRMCKFFDEVILFLDNDPAGWTGQRALAKNLYRKLLVRSVRYPRQFIGDPENLVRSGVDIVPMILNSDLIVI